MDFIWEGLPNPVREKVGKCIGILLEAHIDLGDDYELFCYTWLMEIFEICLGD
jgi:hypothetical protein